MSDPVFPAHGPFISPDAMGAAAALVSREYGPTGYALAVAVGDSRTAVFEVNHFDGSRFNVAADKWGNAIRLADDEPTAQEALRQLRRQASEV